jgi:DNA invertase Pin-like site-specific DNA recombinase
MRKAAVYLCVSTLDQNTGNQELELREIASRMDCEVVKVYRDDGGSGTKRAQLDRLRWDASNRKFDVVIAWSVDRLARSLKELLGLFSEMRSLKIDLYVHRQKIDTTTPAGKAMLAATDVFAELERAIALERLRTGRAKVKQYGVKLGRPRRIAPSVESAIRDALQKGDAGMIRIGKRFGVGTGTVQRIKAEMNS